MIIVVGESSVIVDLEYSDLLTPALGCGFTLAIVDLLFSQVSYDDGVGWQARGVVVLNLFPAEVETAQAIKRERTALSFAECFALSRAARPQHVLVTDSPTLRGAAQEHGVSAHDSHWLMDQMARTGKVTAEALRDGMTQLVNRGRRRQSSQEIEARYQEWGRAGLAVA